MLAAPAAVCQVLDRYHAGWFSMAYWADVADLAAQAAASSTYGGVTAATLFQERHSIFFKR
jgi:hypothetical protein